MTICVFLSNGRSKYVTTWPSLWSSRVRSSHDRICEAEHEKKYHSPVNVCDSIGPGAWTGGKATSYQHPSLGDRFLPPHVKKRECDEWERWRSIDAPSSVRSYSVHATHILMYAMLLSMKGTRCTVACILYTSSASRGADLKVAGPSSPQSWECDFQTSYGESRGHNSKSVPCDAETFLYLRELVAKTNICFSRKRLWTKWLKRNKKVNA